MPKKPTAPASMPSEIAMRRALAARDAVFDGAFVYGVITTGVYCRPSCASRPAKPSNVRFFPGPDAAERAGLRSCKRCKPRAAHDQAVERMQTLARYIEAHAEEPLSLKKLSTRVHLSPAHLQRTFKNVVGISPKAFHDASRLRLLKGALKAGKSVLESKMLQRLGYPRHLRSGQQAKKSLYPDLIGAGADVLGALLRLKLGKTITQGCPSG